MTRVQVFDPPMCCSTGVCGPEIDPKLVRFNDDFHWLAGRGVLVERYNLAGQPQQFNAHAAVQAALAQDGLDCLPLIVVNGQVAVRGRYPERAELARLAGVSDSGAEAGLSVLSTPCCDPESGCC